MQAKYIGLASLLLISYAAPALSAQCPDGFVNVGEAYAEDSKNNSEAKVAAKPVLVTLPKNFKIDSNYRQRGGRWSGGSARAVMTDSDVPNGLHIIAHGTEGGAKGWAVHKPEQKIIEEQNERIVQRGYEMKLYCHTGSGAVDMVGHVSCNVGAVFCAKPRK